MRKRGRKDKSVRREEQRDVRKKVWRLVWAPVNKLETVMIQTGSNWSQERTQSWCWFWRRCHHECPDRCQSLQKAPAELLMLDVFNTQNMSPVLQEEESESVQTDPTTELHHWEDCYLFILGFKFLDLWLDEDRWRVWFESKLLCLSRCDVFLFCHHTSDVTRSQFWWNTLSIKSRLDSARSDNPS